MKNFNILLSGRSTDLKEMDVHENLISQLYEEAKRQTKTTVYTLFLVSPKFNGLFSPISASIQASEL